MSFDGFFEPTPIYVLSEEHAEFILRSCGPAFGMMQIWTTAPVAAYIERRRRELMAEDAAIDRGDAEVWWLALPRLLEGWKFVGMCVLCDHTYDSHHMTEPLGCRCCFALTGKAVPVTIRRRRSVEERFIS